ncbi:MAG: S8 family serine peptidase, partial [Acidobacteria bacterium]|nr:S8 family serine peptidase [Acidobacteriota bacterium]
MADLNWGYELYNKGNLHQTELAGNQPYVLGQIIVKTNYDEIRNLLWFLPLKNAVIIPPEMLLMYKYSYIKDITPLAINGYQVLEIDDNCDIVALREQLLSDGLVEDASLNYIASILDITPNDPNLIYQYALTNTGQVYRPGSDMQGNPGCDIKAPGGWEWSTGGGEIVIAIIDSGVASDHEDLTNQVVPGYNFSGDNNNAYDDHGHGTFVASIAAAETNNGKGMAGV